MEDPHSPPVPPSLFICPSSLQPDHKRAISTPPARFDWAALPPGQMEQQRNKAMGDKGGGTTREMKQMKKRPKRHQMMSLGLLVSFLFFSFHVFVTNIFRYLLELLMTKVSQHSKMTRQWQHHHQGQHTTACRGDGEVEQGNEMGQRQQEDNNGVMRGQGEQQQETWAQTTIVIWALGNFLLCSFLIFFCFN
jgi:hypothetical protein